MSTLAVIVSIWALVATCAALFIRGASPRLERAPVLAERRPARAPIAE
ncbi:hypothetical protein [Trinickia diaoshuihuensis]|nr:hypothetical protein [Trinickia diaoshuihuensis]